MKKFKYLYIPLELYHRELRGVLLLASIAAHNGWTIIFGPKTALLPVYDVLPPGVFFPKSVVPGEEPQFLRLVEHGHKIASVDAEGLITDNGELGVVRRYSQKTVELSSLLFFWGVEQYNQASIYIKNITDKSIVTGSPLFDYWRLQKFNYIKPKENLNNKKTILIASSFGMVNHITGLGETPHLQISSAGKEVYEKHFEYLSDTIKVKKITFESFKLMVNDLIKSLDGQYNIIIRPHPSEDISEWEKIINSNESVSIQSGGSISKMLLNCDILIHSDSTTSIEGYYYGKDIIAFAPNNLPDELLKVLNQNILKVSNVCRSSDDIVSIINQIRLGDNLKPKFNLSNIIHACDSLDIAFSSKRIVEALDSIKQETTKQTPSVFVLFFSFNRIITKIKFRFIWVIAWLDFFLNLFDGKYAPRRTRYKYGKTKQDPLDLQTINRILLEVSEGLNSNSKNIKSLQINKYLFMLYTDRKD